MKFEVYGKSTCAKCKSTKDKLTHLLGKADAAGDVALAFHDVETVEGMAEGAFNDVRSVPTVILRSDEGEPLARWEGILPPSGEVQVFLGSARSRASVT
jgi:thioredoxin-like negative regulator of GroEL